MPDLAARLGALHSVLTSRLTLQSRLISLSGRLDLVIAQMDLRSTSGHGTEQAKSHKAKLPTHYDEGDSSDELADADDAELENDDQGSIEDVVLNGSRQDHETSSDKECGEPDDDTSTGVEESSAEESDLEDLDSEDEDSEASDRDKTVCLMTRRRSGQKVKRKVKTVNDCSAFMYTLPCTGHCLRANHHLIISPPVPLLLNPEKSTRPANFSLLKRSGNHSLSSDHISSNGSEPSSNIPSGVDGSWNHCGRISSDLWKTSK